MIIRTKTFVNGIVQGVGFRPFIHKQITGYDLKGWIRNSSVGAEIELEGEEETIQAFTDDLWTKAPPLSLITSVETEKLEGLAGYTDFRIISSDASFKRKTLISPDVCVCEECLDEMRSPGRRYRYPFINCTNCGPRFTIIKNVPYDRSQTTMSVFKMCPDCEREYTDISDRRYHAEPTGCNICGPRLYFTDAEGREIPGDAIETAKAYLREGKIIAVKGLGGFHLACRFDDESLPRLLRDRKHRDEKSFAIMCRDVATALRYCEISLDEEKVLTGYRRPIVLLKKLPGIELFSVSENSRIGIMLPYTPVHFMLFEDDIDALIMTSANISDMPIIYKDDEALENLRSIADGFLMNNREIHTRCDDSVTYVYDGREYPVRRSRGFVPYPIIMKKELGSILALGAEQKASFCLSMDNFAIPSQHIGDMKNMETFENYRKQITHFENLYEIRPQALACDLHPDYISTVYGEKRAADEGLPLYRIQHHHAHLASCMADNDIDEKVIGIIWDGTGLGTDGNIWGGEFLLGDYSSFERLGHIRYIRLPGGDKAVKELWRVGISLLADCGLDPVPIFDEDKCSAASIQLKSGLNCPLSSGMGRLFDGVSALLGIKTGATYEGQGAILLEAAATSSTRTLDYDIVMEDGETILDWRPMIKQIYNEILSGADAGELSAAFMNTLAQAAARIAARISKQKSCTGVVLSGGTFNNMYLMDRLPGLLRREGLSVYIHHRVSCGDEGLSLGQLMIADRLLLER